MVTKFKRKKLDEVKDSSVLLIVCLTAIFLMALIFQVFVAA